MQILLILLKYQWEEQLLRLERKATTAVEVVKYPGVGTVASIAASPSSLLPSTVGILQYQDRRVILMLYTGKREVPNPYASDCTGR